MAIAIPYPLRFLLRNLLHIFLCYLLLSSLPSNYFKLLCNLHTLLLASICAFSFYIFVCFSFRYFPQVLSVSPHLCIRDGLVKIYFALFCCSCSDLLWTFCSTFVFNMSFFSYLLVLFMLFPMSIAFIGFFSSISF